MDIGGGEIHQHMDVDMPQGAQRTQRETVSGGGSNIFRSRAAMLDGIGGAVYSAEGRRRKERSGDGIRHVRRESR